MRDAAHALRSSAAHIGAVGLLELCLSWRDLDDSLLRERAAAEVAALRRELARLRAALADVVAAAPAPPLAGAATSG